MRGGYYGGAMAQLTCAQVLLPASHSSTSKSLARRTRPASLEAMFFAALPASGDGATLASRRFAKKALAAHQRRAGCLDSLSLE